MDYTAYINKRVQQVPPSGIRKFFDIASEMKDAISLGVGEPDFVTPWRIREAAIFSVERGHTHYTSNHGMPELREKIAEYLALRFGLHYKLPEVMISVGASEGIDLAMRAILEPGDEVLIPEPCYVAYMPAVIFAGGTPVPIVTDAQHEFKLVEENVRACITPKTKAIIVPYPNNPTGATMTKDELCPIAKLILEHDLICVSDEIYAELTYGGEHCSIAALPGMWERTILVSGFSKAFAMTGWRIGYLCAPQPFLDAMVKIHQYSMLCAPTMGQAAALEAMTSGLADDFSEVEAMRRQYNRRRLLMVEAFNAMGLACFEPRGAFYVFPSVASTGMNAETFCHRLLMEQQVAVVPGSAFGESCTQHIRCSYAASIDNLTEALRRIEAFLQTL